MPTGGGPAIIFSLPFMGMGIFIVLLSLGFISYPDDKFHAHRLLAASFGGLFFFAGLSLFIAGIKDLGHKRKVEELFKNHPHLYWKADYNWNEKEIKDNNSPKVAALHFLKLFLFCLFLFPFNWLIFSTTEKISLFPKIIMGIFDLVLVIILGECTYILGRFSRNFVRQLWRTQNYSLRSFSGVGKFYTFLHHKIWLKRSYL